MRTVLAAVLLMLLVAATAVAQVPEKMNYQVMLTNDLDEPLADQSVTLVFRIYDADTGGTLKWSETHNTTTNSIGVMSVVLGSVASMFSQDFNQNLWLEIEVDGQILSPRRELVSAPYAFYAADSDGMGGHDADDYVMNLELSLAGTINDPDNPVDWTRLKNVPAGFADGTDDEGGGAGDGHSLDAVDGDPTDALFVEADGTVAIGSATSGGSVDIYADGPADPVVSLYTFGSFGGLVSLFDGSGNFHTSLEPDFDGSGGFFLVNAGSGAEAFVVDGSYSGGDPLVAITGGASSTYFNTFNTGDSSVELPPGAVSSTEMQSEPGVSSSALGSSLPLDGNARTLLSRSIYCPSSGYVLAIATVEAQANHAAGTNSGANFGVSNSSSSFPRGGEVYARIPHSASTGNFVLPVTVQWIFPATEGAHTYYLLADEIVGDWSIFDRHLSLIFFPTHYAVVAETNLEPPSNTDGSIAEPGVPLREADIAAERAETEAAYHARVKAELAAMEARIAELRASMGNNQ